MSEKKMGPREAELRAMREAREQKRVIANKAQIDALTKFKMKGVGSLKNIKASGKRGGRGK
jgi:hypothetical protein